MITFLPSSSRHRRRTACRTAASARWAIALAGLLVLGPAFRPAAAQASTTANATTPLELTAYTTLISAGFEWRLDGDDNGDCGATVEYRHAGEAWREAQPLLRVEHGIWTHGEDPGNLLAGSIFFLKPGTAYEARLTLSDPDGGSEQRVVAFTTRSVPPAGSGRVLYVTPGTGGGAGGPADPFRGLAAADSTAQPGDLFLLQPGTYHGRFTVTRDGTASQPIVYRGTDQAAVILDGDGGADSTSHCVILAGRRYVYLENLSAVSSLRPIDADSTVGVAVRGCFIQPVNLLIDAVGIRAACSRDLLIADNTLLMPGQWATIGRTGTYGTGGYGILVEGTGHVICHNTVIEAWDGISIPVTGTGVPACTTSNVDVYENYVDRASDDGIQADATQQNVRLFRNRLLNTGSGVSLQPIFGGPGYLLHNEIYNNRIEPYKCHPEVFYGWRQETSGFIAYHNTSICSRQGWYESDSWRHGTFNNNLILGGRETYTLRIGYTCVGARFDYDGYNRVNGYPNLVYYKPNAYADLTALYAGAGQEQHGVELTTGAFVNAPLPHNPEWNYPNGYGAAYGPADFDLQLSPGSPAVDAACVLANINDGYVGAGPDLGCHESGAAPPHYGPRTGELVAFATAGQVPGATARTVHFTGEAANVIGRGAAYHWAFGDSAGASDEQSPLYVYGTEGTFAATLTVMDDDGAVASDTVIVVAGTPLSVDGPSAGAALAPNGPNPFVSSTTIRFSLPARTTVRLGVYNIGGAVVRTLVAGELPAGGHAIVWDGRTDDGVEAAPGVYFLRLAADGIARTRRMTLVR
jgi:hypothetical protein